MSENEDKAEIQSSCACLIVRYVPEKSEDGKLRERWKCESCEAVFVRLTAAIATVTSALAFRHI